MSYQPTLQTFISTVNSSTATLTSGSVFTGTSEDVSLYSEIRIYVISDVASGTNGLSIQQSSDGTNWDVTDTYTVPAASGKTYGVGVSAKFFRLVYTNGGTNQASFRLQCSFHAVRTKPSSVRPQDARTNDNDMEEVASYDMIYDPINNVWNRLVTSQAITGQTAQTAVVNNIIPATVSSAGTNVGPYVFGSVQIVSTGTGGTFIFESANSDANYTTMTVWNNAVLTGTPITAAITPTSSNITYYFPITSNFIRVRIATTITGGAIQALTKIATTSPFPITSQVAQATAANLNTTSVIASGTVTTVTTLTGTTTLTPGTGATNLGKAKANAAGATDTGVTILAQRTDTPAVQSATGNYVLVQADRTGALQVKQIEKSLKTYSASDIIAPAAAATDIAILPGNGTTTVYVTKVQVSGIQTTGGLSQVFLIKRSTANTAGTSTSMTAVPHDAGDAAASSVPLNYSANPTVGTPIGSIRRTYAPFGALTVTTNGLVEFNFGDKGKPIILSGVTQGLAVNLNGATLTGGSIDVTYEWYEL